MRNTSLNRFFSMMLTLVMTSMLVTPVLAAPSHVAADKKRVAEKKAPDAKTELLKSIKAQDDKIQFTAEELEEMRTALLELLDSVQAFAGLLSPEARIKAGMQDFGEQMTKGQSSEARSQIHKMSSQELTTLRKVLNPEMMRTKLAASRAALSEYKDNLAKAASETGNRGTLPGITSYCGAPVSSEAIIAADAVFFIAEGVRDIAQNVCNQVVLGANLRSGCNVTDAIYLVAKGVNQGIHFCDDDYAASVGEANFARLGHIHDDIEDVKANDNTNYTNTTANGVANTTTITGAITTATNTIVSNDNANALALTTLVNAALTQIISNANANKDETKNLLLRTQIEADLASTDGSTFVALYETPATVCFPALNSFGLPQPGIAPSNVQCGLLDLVRSIVQQSIANVGAGTNAQAFFNTGDTQRAAGNFKAAYTSYRKAYKAAAK